LARAGHDILAVARTESELERTCHDVENDATRCVAFRADLAQPDAAGQIVARAVEAFGRVDVLINNAGVAPLAAIEEMTDEDLDRCLAVNIRAVIALTRAVWPVMRNGGGGVIVTVSSLASVDPFPGFAAYGGSKAFVNVFTQAIAQEGKAAGIRAYAVAPGAVETRTLRGAFPDFPAEQCLAPDEVAAQIEILLDEGTRLATGQTVFVRK